MTYNPTNWKDEIVTDPNKYKITKENGTEEIVDIERALGKIIQEGTRITADKLNNIEKGIKGAADLVNDLAGVERTNETVKGNAEDIGSVSARMAELATNNDTATLDQALLSNGDGTSTFKDIRQIPSGGSVGQFLAWGGSSGTAKWEDIQTKKFLYKAGVYYTDLDVGYLNGYDSEDIMRNGILQIYNFSINSPGQEGTIVTNSPIDLTGFNTITVDARLTSYSADVDTYIVISSSKMSSHSVYNKRIYKRVTNTNYSPISLPINHISGSYYIRLHNVIVVDNQSIVEFENFRLLK